MTPVPAETFETNTATTQSILGSTACAVEGCECVAFEEDPDAGDDDDGEEEPNIVRG